MTSLRRRWRAYWAPLGFPWVAVVGSLALSALMVAAVVLALR